MAGLKSFSRINGLIEHTILKPDTTTDDIKRYCDETDHYGFHGVCVPPCYVRLAKRLIRKGKVISVAGFPLGLEKTEAKVFQIESLAKDGVDEIDVVFNIGFIRERRFEKLEDEIRELIKVKGDRPLKVIIETPLLSEELIRRVSKLLMDHGVDFIKTGTGFHGSVKIKDVRIIAQVTKGKVGIKAAGGIRTYEQAKKLIQAGATRIGTSTGKAIVNAGQSSS